jgi:riboflavin kinase/FMN adenylyltransferase
MADPTRVDRMAVVAGIDALRAELGRLFIVVGVFDGLHLGHLYLLGRLREEAARRNASPAVITFDHHPDEILTGAAPPLLCDADERLERLAAAGVEVTVVQHFDVALRMTEFDEFIRRIARGAPLAGILMTPDSAFGHERRGTPEAVATLGSVLGYDVEVIPALELDGRPVRSGEIRSDIAAGDLAGAARLLGRPYAVVGEGRPAAGGRLELVVPMPVALPPAGDYPVRIASVPGPGDAAGAESAGAEAAGSATVDAGGGLAMSGVAASGIPAHGSRWRVVFPGKRGRRPRLRVRPDLPSCVTRPQARRRSGAGGPRTS